jgi:hypothetical protein
MRSTRDFTIDHKLFVRTSDRINCGASGDSIRNGKYTLPINKIELEGVKTFIYASGMIHNGINSSIDAFLMTPIEQYIGETKTLFKGEFWDGGNYIGVIFSCNKKQYVVAEVVRFIIDPRTIDFVTSMSEVMEYEGLMSKQGGWRALTFDKQKPKLIANSHMVTGLFSHNKNSWHKSMVVSYVRVKGKIETLRIGTCEDEVNPFLSMVIGGVVDSISTLIKTAAQVINTPLGKENQMSLF